MSRQLRFRKLHPWGKPPLPRAATVAHFRRRGVENGCRKRIGFMDSFFRAQSLLQFPPKFPKQVPWVLSKGGGLLRVILEFAGGCQNAAPTAQGDDRLDGWIHQCR